MNRENIFKAKRKDNGEWVEGYYVYDYSHDAHYIFANIIATPNGVHDRRESFSLEYYEIDPYTLCQYTGLTDEDGWKIWENDIVKCKKYIGADFIDYNIEIDYSIEVGYVEMKLGAFGLHRIKYDSYYRPFKDWLEDYECKVIGNIFDNPELLEVE